MMVQAIDILSWVALLAGSFFYVVGAIGLNRMPDIFTRMHAVSVSETLGVGLLILGMMLQAGLTLITVKLGIILVVMLWTGAVASHALARAALHDGERPMLADAKGRLTRTDPVTLFPELAVRLATPLTSETGDDGAAGELPADDTDGNSTAGEANRDARVPGGEAG